MKLMYLSRNTMKRKKWIGIDSYNVDEVFLMKLQILAKYKYRTDTKVKTLYTNLPHIHCKIFTNGI